MLWFQLWNRYPWLAIFRGGTLDGWLALTLGALLAHYLVIRKVMDCFAVPSDCCLWVDVFWTGVQHEKHHRCFTQYRSRYSGFSSKTAPLRSTDKLFGPASKHGDDGSNNGCGLPAVCKEPSWLWLQPKERLPIEWGHTGSLTVAAPRYLWLALFWPLWWSDVAHQTTAANVGGLSGPPSLFALAFRLAALWLRATASFNGNDYRHWALAQNDLPFHKLFSLTSC